MKVLVIPDVHLKPWMFDQAAAIMNAGEAETAVCLMDLADDWKQEYNIDLYIQTYDAALQFALDFPTSLWCYGNHDLSYVWRNPESGYSSMAEYTVTRKMQQMEVALGDRLAFVHRIDQVLFMHGGLTDYFVAKYVKEEDRSNIDKVLAVINNLGEKQMWSDLSPLWLRPQSTYQDMYRPEDFLQVVGHTPVKEITRKKNILSCDVFSLTSMRKPYGSQLFPVVDTETWNYRELSGVRYLK